MGYSGFTEFLCPNGHYITEHAHARWDGNEPVNTCKCGAWWALTHQVDTTNGYDERYPDTHEAPKEEIGWDDIPCSDHYGNKYYLKRLKFKPVGDEWKSFPTKEEMDEYDKAAQQEEAERQRLNTLWHNTPPLDKYRVFAGEMLLAAFDAQEAAEEFYFDQETSTKMIPPEGLNPVDPSTWF